MKPSAHLLPCCLLLCGATLGQATEPAPAVVSPRAPAALEILKQVEAAVGAVRSVRFEVRRELAGVALEYGAPARGTIVLVGWSGGAPAKFWARVQGGREGEPIEMTAGSDGQTYFVLDHVQKTAYEESVAEGTGSTARSLMSMGLLEFVQPGAFDDELAAEVVEFAGEETIDGEPCQTIRVRYERAGEESLWSFSTRDHLPRRRLRLLRVPGRGEGSVETTVRHVEINVEPDAALFRLALPEGYERVDGVLP